MATYEELLAELDIRPINKNDYNFILSNWAKSYKTSKFAGVIPNYLYHQVMKHTLDNLLNRGMIIQVACNRNNHEQLLGFIAYELSDNGVYVLHYIFVKPDFRENGISKLLKDSVGLPSEYLITHWTKKQRPPKTFLPAIARRKYLEPVYLNNYGSPNKD